MISLTKSINIEDIFPQKKFLLFPISLDLPNMLWSNNIHPQHEEKKGKSYRRIGRTMTPLKEIKTERPYTLSGT